MSRRKLASTSALVLLVLAGVSPRISNAGQSEPPVPQGVAVYVADFELLSAVPDSPRPDDKDKLEKDLQLRSRQIQDCFAEALVETFRKQGYSPSRKQDLPGKGILLQGVFAEADEKNRIRRALLGSGSPGTTLKLYVGAFDPASVSQPLYREAPEQEPDPNYGPVITLNVYIPMGKYEIGKDASQEEIRRISGQIAADLTLLLQRNPAWLAQAQ